LSGLGGWKWSTFHRIERGDDIFWTFKKYSRPAMTLRKSRTLKFVFILYKKSFCWMYSCELHPKTLWEIAMVLSTNSGSFPSSMLLKATFPSSYLGLVEATLAALKKCPSIRPQMWLYKVSSTAQILKFAYVFIHAVGWTAPPHSPIKTLRQRQPETGWHG